MNCRVEYGPYGELAQRFGDTDTPFLFVGAYGVQTDPNGLNHMRARYYSPETRRFLNADPIGFSGGMNWYAYANGNPVMFIDPLGWAAQGRQQASAQSDPVNFEGAITYRKGALLLSHGRFSGYVISDTNPPQLIYVEGYLNGIGFQVGVISGKAPVRFAAPSVEALSGSNQGGLFQAELSFGVGPATAVGGEGTLGAFPDRQGGHSFTGSASGQFMEVSPVVSAFDLLERPKFGAGFGASFTGVTVREARVVRIISPDK